MDMVVYNKLFYIFQRDDISINEIKALLCAETIEELTDILKTFINDNFQELAEADSFFDDYHLFLFSLTDKVKDVDDLFAIKNLIINNINVIKTDLKQFTKGRVAKNDYYYRLEIIVNKFKNLNKAIDFKLKNSYDNEEFNIVWFIITELKNPDYLFRIFELHPDYVNIKDQFNNPLFISMCNYILANINELSNDDIKYYKRVFVLFLESDTLRLTNEELYGLLENLEKNKISASIEHKKDINFLINEIGEHYEIINQDARINAVSFCNKECPIDIIKRGKDDRVDFRDDFIVSIDAVSGHSMANHLIDDAISVKINGDGTYYLIIHIPDVDYYVAKDSETDKYMRRLGESVYARGYKTPMLNYDIANKCSLKAGVDRPTISFAIKLDSSGNIMDLDFYQGIARVNYNLTRHQAEIFMKNNKDRRLFFIKKMYQLAVMMRKNRKEKVGGRSKASIIMDEANIYPDLLTADYFMKNGIIFPYKNYAGKRSKTNTEHVSACASFATSTSLSEEGKNILYSVFDIQNRVYYDTENKGNKSFGGLPAGNVGNPLREYISLETDRLIKDIIINGEHNEDYWQERIERDCIEYTETSARIKQLYQKSN